MEDNKMTHRKSLKVLLLGYFVLLASVSVACWGAVDAELLKKAKAGDAEAQFILGGKYVLGRGVVEDNAEAVKWYRKASEQGHSLAQVSLGVMYAKGKGVAQDSVEAVKWYRKAAEQGNAGGQTNLSVMYYYGEGVAQDSVLAHMWLNLARAQGAEVGEMTNQNLATLVKRMTKEQIAEAQKMASEWQAKHSSVSN